MSANPVAGVGGEGRCGSGVQWVVVGSLGSIRTQTVRATAVKDVVFPDRVLYLEFCMLRLCFIDLCFSQMLEGGVGMVWARSSGMVSCTGIRKEAERGPEPGFLMAQAT